MTTCFKVNPIAYLPWTRMWTGMIAKALKLLIFNGFLEGNGAPEEIRTPDPQIRSLVLYPAELRVRAVFAAASGVQLAWRSSKTSPVRLQANFAFQMDFFVTNSITI